MKRLQMRNGSASVVITKLKWRLIPKHRLYKKGFNCKSKKSKLFDIAQEFLGILSSVSRMLFWGSTHSPFFWVSFTQVLVQVIKFSANFFRK